jgi:hypothetical protein
MNRLDPLLPPRREAKLRYLDHDFEVLQEGEFVRCSVTGDPIRLDNLRYWSIAKQVAFKSAAEAFSDYLSGFATSD